MKLTRSGIASVAVLCTLGLVGGGAALVSPASASAGVNWGHIFKKEIKPRADKRYYTKKKANARFSVKSALLGYYTKAESDAKYAAAGSSYSKAESDANYYTKTQADAKYAPFPSLITGMYIASGMANTVEIDGQISWGVTLTAAPAVHFIKVGDPIPSGCSGTSAAPNAAPGNLCVFENGFSNVGSRLIASASGFANTASVNGAYVLATPSTTSFAFSRGTWALRPTGITTSAVGRSGGLNVAPHNGGRGTLR